MTDRDPRVLNDPALKVTPRMLAAFEAALDLEEPAEGRLTVSLVDADVLLDPPKDGRQVRANRVEILIDHDGVLVVGTGWDVTRPVFARQLELPYLALPALRKLFEVALGDLAARAMAVVLASVRMPLPPNIDGYL